MGQTTPRHIAVTVDVNDLEGMTRFWSELLAVDAEISEPFAFLSPGEGRKIALWLQRVPEPRVGKNRVHLDFAVADLEGTEERIVELGGSLGERQRWETYEWRICSDPEGNVFDVMRAPQN